VTQANSLCSTELQWKLLHVITLGQRETDNIFVSAPAIFPHSNRFQHLLILTTSMTCIFYLMSSPPECSAAEASDSSVIANKFLTDFGNILTDKTVALKTE
jgi:hypothetical protein